MFFSLKELVQWLGLTVFEIWIDLVSITVFSVLVAIKIEEAPASLDWWIVFSPLFAADALNAYFCVIVLIRMYLGAMYKVAFLRALWSLFFLTLLFVFEFFLCKKLSGQSVSNEYSEILAPVFVLLQFMAVRACQLQ